MANQRSPTLLYSRVRLPVNSKLGNGADDDVAMLMMGLISIVPVPQPLDGIADISCLHTCVSSPSTDRGASCPALV